MHGADQVTTTTAGVGYGVFGNVPVSVGSVKVQVALTGTTCLASRDALPSDAAGWIELPVVAGFFTHVAVVCQ